MNHRLDFSSLEDPELVQLFKQGHQQAFDCLWLRHRQRTYDVACYLLGDPLLAEDITAEVFAAVYRDLGSFKLRCKFTTWLYRVTANACKRELGKIRKRVTMMPLHEAEAIDPEGPEEIVESRMTLQRALELLGQLSDAERLALTLFYLCEQTYGEISQATGMPVNTAKSHVRRGLIKLREIVNTDIAGHSWLEATTWRDT